MSLPEIELRVFQIVDDFGRQPDVHLANFHMTAVPDKNEPVSIDGKNYVVGGRSWSLRVDGPKICILRVRAAG